MRVNKMLKNAFKMHFDKNEQFPKASRFKNFSHFLCIAVYIWKYNWKGSFSFERLGWNSFGIADKIFPR